ncbi:MAG: CotH kinase family protein [Bacteroidota bacterium]
MRIKDASYPNEKQRLSFRHKLRIIVLTVIATGLVGTIVLLVLLKQLAPIRFQQLKTAISQLPNEFLEHGQAIGTEIPVVNLHIGHSEMEILAEDRAQAIEELLGQGFRYVSADVEWQEQMLAGKVRLKGDRFVHFSHHHRWSFRVQLKDDHRLAGMKHFSLHRAGARNYLHEWMFHQVLAQEGLVALRYEFVRLNLNGKDLGIYALEEHFDKHLIENSRFREGPILKLDESLSAENLNLSWAAPFRTSVWTDSLRRPQLELAIQQLEAFKQGKLKASEVFDVEKTATFLAICDLLSVPHGAIWKNLRFYFNPITARLEPVGYDGHFQPEQAPEPFLLAGAIHQPEIPYFHDYSPWFRRFFYPTEELDTALFQAYTRELDRLSKEAYVGSLLGTLQPGLEQHWQQVHLEFPTQADHLFWYGPDVYQFDQHSLRNKAAYIRWHLRPRQPRLLAYRGEQTKGNLQLGIANLHFLPLELTAVHWQGQRFPLSTPAVFAPSRPTHLPEWGPDLQLLSMDWPIGLPNADSIWQQLQVSYQVMGIADSFRIVPVLPWERSLDQDLPPPLQRPNAQQFPAMLQRSPKGGWLLSPGKWIIHQPIIIGEQETLFAGPGTHLHFSGSGCLISYGALQWKGAEEAPILVTADSTSTGGLAVFQAHAVSQLEEVVFKGLATPAGARWTLTGGVTFYESEVHMQRVSWVDARGEDALNLIRSPFSLSACEWMGSSGDALDVDFGEGTLSRCRFLQTGNDAVDLSGSQVLLTNCQIDQAGDKGISVGEASQLRIEQVAISHSRLGVAVKDLSRLQAKRLHVQHAQIAITAYQKKPEFGPGSLHLTAWESLDNETDLYLETGTTARINGQSIPGTAKQVAQELDAPLIE